MAADSTQKPLSAILDEIVANAESGEKPINVLTLLKALRRALPAIESHGYLAADIASILNERNQ